MTEYQQADTLFTGTDVGFSGSGSATPAPADGGSDYTAWQWEVVLATVLGLSIPGRAEVTGQPWLTIEQNGQGGTGLHLIWSASWNTKSNSDGASLQAYLNPDLYTVGGAWDLFVSAPSGPMSAAAAHNYAGLPLDPQTFDSAGTSVANVTAMLAAVAQQFTDLRSQATTGESGFHGNMADVVAQLLGELGTISQSLHDQMTEPTSYSQSVGAAGTAATAFLTSLQSAYNGWLAVPEHSPLGAIVTVLMRIATQDSSGAYVIADPQHTIYGDLTTAAAWPAVEQAARDLWSDALTGNSDFAGLDPLSRSALSNLVSQYEATTSAIVPVLGPAPPRPKTNPVGGGTGSGGTGGPGDKKAVVVGGPSGGPSGNSGPGPGPGPGPILGTGPGSSSGKAFAVTPGPGATGVTGPGVDQNFAANVAAPSAQGALPGSGPGAGPAAGGPGAAAVAFPGIATLGVGAGAGSAGSGRATGLVGNSIADNAALALSPDGTTDDTGAGITATALAGPIGVVAVPPQDRSLALTTNQAGPPIGVIGLPIGAIGLTGQGDGSGNQGRSQRKATSAREEPALPVTAVTGAGVAIGRTEIKQPVQPPAVTPATGSAQATRSGPLNTELVPATAPGSPGTASQPGPLSGLSGEPGIPLDGQAAKAGGPEANAVGPDGEPMMLMPGMGVGGGQRDQDRQRIAYLPQDEEYWGTDTSGAVAPIGMRDVTDPPEQDFESNPALARIGAGHGIGSSKQVSPDRRKQ